MRKKTRKALPTKSTHDRGWHLHVVERRACDEGYLQITERFYNAARQLDRRGGPAVIERDTDPHVPIVTEIYYENGFIHRDDGPAEIVRNGNVVTRQGYWNHGRRHREGGPAVIETLFKGDRPSVDYYIDGRWIKAGPKPPSAALIKRRLTRPVEPGIR